jgi:hypothetical protein
VVRAFLVFVALAVAACGHKPPPGVEDAIDRGVAYLVSAQNKDGSWGSPASNLNDIYAPGPGSYYTFQVASTSLAASALLECGDGRPGAEASLQRATDFLLAHHVVKRISQDVLYNTWAHAYSLEFFARRLAREKDPAKRDAYAKAAAADVDRLVRYEYVDGGWGYYDFDFHTKTPGHGATSFTTASCLVALKMAADQGVAVPKKLTDRAVALVEHCRAPGGVFGYDFDLRFLPRMGVNHVKGALARTPACLYAIDLWGKKCGEDAAKAALDNLDKDGHFLLIARKYPVPHETWYQNSGYFCFYGYYYASRLVDLAPAGDRDRYRAQIASCLVPLQEKDGSFWDYQLYGYHKAYGTGYVLLTLANCR